MSEAAALEGHDLCAPVSAWFSRRFAAPTEPQRGGWPLIARGEDALISAPTGSGKTLTAFLGILDRLVRRALAGELEDRVEAVYVSPLRALSHDIHKNLEAPLAEIREEAQGLGLHLPEIRAAVRTGDTPPYERQQMLRRPPHILVTTPESLYLLVTAERSREILRSARTVIVDEIHALARDKRGSHLSLTLARLDALADERPVRIGLSATQRPIERLARFLVGADRSDSSGGPLCNVLDLGHQRDLDLSVRVPDAEDLHAVAPAEQMEDLLDALASLIREHRTTLIFSNTRRLAERLAHRLGEKLGADSVAAHHGSLSRDRRLDVEARLRAGDLQALVATASLELGIDIGSVDLVCQLGSPRSIAAFLQRVGRSGHALGLRPKGRLFPTTRDELVECAALARAVRAGRLDRIDPPRAPLDILAQQLVATCAGEEWAEDDLFALVRRADSFGALARKDFDAVIEMLSRGIETPKGRRASYLHRDRLRGLVRGRRGARLAALTSGGAIPETGDYRVLLDPDDTLIGTVNEDWAVESMPGDIFLLGTHSWRIRRIESSVVRVVDAEGAPPTLPFWLGEAPARTAELCQEISDLRREVAERLAGGLDPAVRWLEKECLLDEPGARQLARYVQVQLESVGMVPTQGELLVERFFDEAGGMQLVVHCPYGARVNRGFGLALRKRFCRSFNMELQAAASDDAFVLSLGSPQTFPLESIRRFLSSKTIRDTLEQAFLGSPLFTARWRWNATRSLAVLRARGGRRVPFPVQRMQSDDLMAAVFPEQAACQENVTFPIELPDHPLVNQTVHDCLYDAADLEGLTALLEALESDRVRMHVLDTVEPSPFSHEILNARPYAFLDDAPLEERRTRAVALRHVLPQEARDLGRLDPEAIARVREEAAPVVRDPDELYELLVDLVLLREENMPWDPAFAATLVAAGRAARIAGRDGVERLFAAERLPEVQGLLGTVSGEPAIELPEPLRRDPVEEEVATDAAVRGHLAIVGPTTAAEIAERTGIAPSALSASFARLESRGIGLRGAFDPDLEGEQLCDRGLLARIHRYTLDSLRKEIEPVSARAFLRFLLEWQHVEPESHLGGEGGALVAIEQLSGFEAASAAWESDLLAARVEEYKPGLLDQLCLSGQTAWGRLTSRALDARSQTSRATPIALFPRSDLEELLHAAAREAPEEGSPLRGPAARILELLEARGALFSREIEAATRLLASQVDEGLRELVARGRVTCDGYAPLRKLLAGAARSARRRPGRTRLVARGVTAPEGRWGLLTPYGDAPPEDEAAEAAAMRLLRRYGVVFRDLLVREWLPGGWREIHRALRRLEARGQVRGGRFVSGFIGEQFALPEAVAPLRKKRDVPDTGREIRVSAADPLNLVGILTPGPRLPAGHTRWLIYRDALPVAVIEKGTRRNLTPEQGVTLATQTRPSA